MTPASVRRGGHVPSKNEKVAMYLCDLSVNLCALC